MRIIAGTRRSLPLCAPPGKETRPTTDRIKETLFNILQDRIHGCYFLDLFAGSGQIGLEALSRGARFSCFVEQGREACKCITDNIRFTRFEKESLLLPMEAERALRRLEGKKSFDLVFIDPPYESSLEQGTLRLLKETGILNRDAWVILEAPIRAKADFAEVLGYTVFREKEYKTNKHIFMKENG